MALARVLGEGVNEVSVVIGRDTRASGPELEGWLTRGLESCSAKVTLAGVLSTPAVAHIVLGRSFTEEEARAEAPVIVLGHELFQSLLGGDAERLGETAPFERPAPHNRRRSTQRLSISDGKPGAACRLHTVELSRLRQ